MTSILIVNSWPDSLPLPFVDYQAAHRNTTRVSPLSAGRIARRARFRKTYAQLSASWRFGTTEKRIFEDYYETTLGCGVALFSIDLRLPKNSELTNWAVRFGEGGYEIEYQEGIWQVTATVELVIPSVLDTGAVDPNAGLNNFLVGTDASSGDAGFFVEGESSGMEEFFVMEETGS